jgi:hypothetical protein
LHAGAVVVGHAFGLAPPLSPSHGTHLPIAEHTGLFGLVQFAEVLHSMHVLDGTSQNGVGAEQVVSSMQGTQTPALQRGVGALHCASVVQAALQMWLWQNGFSGSWQSPGTLHSTQTLSVVSQTGLPGMSAHAEESLALHCSQVPGPVGDGTHAGFAAVGHFEVAPELKLPLHCTHCLLVQTGVAAGHVALVRQFTQTPCDGGMSDPTSQTVLSGLVQSTPTPGVFESQSTHFPALRPVRRQAGSAAVQGNLFAGPGGEPKSPEQPTQTLFVVSQVPLLPVHAVVLVALHWTHALFTQAGSAAVGHAPGTPLPKSPVHEVQPWLMQTGRPAGQSADVLHGWQATVGSPAPGAGQLSPPLIFEPRHWQGLKLVRLPHGSPGTRCVHVPSTRPVTLP